VADVVPGWLGARLVGCQVCGKSLVKPAWLFPGHLIVVRSGSRNATRKARAGAGVSSSSAKIRKKEGMKEKPLQINL